MLGTPFIRRFLAVAMALSVAPFQLPAKNKKQPKAIESPRSAGLKIYVLEGDKGINFIPDRIGITPVVEVRDDYGLPVEKANVEFRLPDSGAGGQFEDGSRVKNVLTNTSGQAQALFTVNSEAGDFAIRIRATLDTRSGSTVITQANSLKPVAIAADGTRVKSRHHWYKNWKVLTVVGAGGAVVAVILLTRGGGGTSAVLTPGSPTFGTPH